VSVRNRSEADYFRRMSGGSGIPTTSTRSRVASSPLREMLTAAIDYAGLFPPAALDIDTALRNYVSYRAGEDVLMLGRFVAPAARLNELAASLSTTVASRVRISAVLGPNISADLDAVADFNARGTLAGAWIDAIEGKADRTDAIYHLASRAPDGFEVFVELPLGDGLELLVAAIRAAGVRAKIRTGGVTADAFPPASAVVRFIRTCLDAGVPFKATAGLHHPVTGTYALTYEPSSPRGTMFGFLNVSLAVAFLAAGMSDEDAALLLGDRDASSFTFGERGVDWRGHRLDSAQLAATHARAFGSFGSCSFREPIDELHSMSLLP
jgi:hypothetical protein